MKKKNQELGIDSKMDVLSLRTTRIPAVRVFLQKRDKLLGATANLTPHQVKQLKFSMLFSQTVENRVFDAILKKCKKALKDIAVADRHEHHERVVGEYLQSLIDEGTDEVQRDVKKWAAALKRLNVNFTARDTVEADIFALQIKVVEISEKYGCVNYAVYDEKGRKMVADCMIDAIQSPRMAVLVKTEIEETNVAVWMKAIILHMKEETPTGIIDTDGRLIGTWFVEHCDLGA